MRTVRRGQRRRDSNRSRAKLPKAPGKNRVRPTTSRWRKEKAKQRARWRATTAWRWNWALSCWFSTSRSKRSLRPDLQRGAFDVRGARVKHQRPFVVGIGPRILDPRDVGRFERRVIEPGSCDLQGIGLQRRVAGVILERQLDAAKSRHENAEGKGVGQSGLPRKPRGDPAAGRDFFHRLSTETRRDGTGQAIEVARGRLLMAFQSQEFS